MARDDRRALVELAGIEEPVDLLSEQILLGAMLIPVYRDTIWSFADDIAPALFGVPMHRVMCTAMQQLMRGETPPDVASVVNACREMGAEVAPEYVSRLWGSALQVMPSLEITVENLRKYQQRRELLLQARRMVTAVVDMREDPMRSAAQVSEALASLGQVASDGPASLAGAMADAAAVVQRRVRGEYPGVRVGIAGLDRMTAGYSRGGLHVIAARPGMGKTALALQMARAIGSRYPEYVTLYISLEMSRAELAYRMLAAEMAVSATRLRLGEIADTERELLVRIRENPPPSLARVYVHDQVLSSQQVPALGKRIRMRYGRLDAVFVDYLGLLADTEFDAFGMVERIERQTRALKETARVLDVPVILLAQLNRLPTTRKVQTPVLSDLRGSGSIEQDADTVLFIHRQSYYDPASQSISLDQPQDAQLILAKNRNGPVGVVDVTWTPSLMMFSERPSGSAVSSSWQDRESAVSEA